MKCPICGGKARCYDPRYNSKTYSTNRRRECVDCLTRFKTVETIVFDSLPDYLREKYMGVEKK
jgi:transcriptional regulator NrdR family protein